MMMVVVMMMMVIMMIMTINGNSDSDGDDDDDDDTSHSTHIDDITTTVSTITEHPCHGMVVDYLNIIIISKEVP